MTPGQITILKHLQQFSHGAEYGLLQEQLQHEFDNKDDFDDDMTILRNRKMIHLQTGGIFTITDAGVNYLTEYLKSQNAHDVKNQEKEALESKKLQLEVEQLEKFKKTYRRDRMIALVTFIILIIGTAISLYTLFVKQAE